LLSKLRDGVLQLNPDITTALLKLVDAIREMLESIERSGVEGEREDAELIETLTALQRVEKAAAAVPRPAVARPTEVPNEAPLDVPTIGALLIVWTP
jgi:two-component system chemotaxis sensor kinase CheA